MTHNPKNIELYIFDWSGVISDDRKPVYETTARVLKQFGKPVPLFDDALKNATMTPVQFYRKAGITEDEQQLKSLFKTYFQEAVSQGNAPTVYREAKKILRYLNDLGKKIFILSSHPEKFIQDEAEQYGISEYISYIQGGSHDKGADLTYIYKKFDYAPKTVLYIGDTIYDIRSAKTAGTLSAGITGGYHAKEQLTKENPDFLFNSLMELADI